MCDDSNQLCICPLNGIIDTISKKWALLIINMLGNHQRLRFNELMDELAGVSPKTLTDTLKILQGEHLVGRESFAEIPPRVEYFLTDEGKELRDAIVPLLKWASKRESFLQEHCTSACKNKSG